jgi:hypothetical protein
MKALRWLLWTNFPNDLRVMMVGSVMNKRVIIWLQMRRQSKFPWRMTAVMRNSVRINDILRGSGVHVESGGKITFYPNTVKYGANVTLLDDHLNLYEALRSKYTSKWEAAMQEEYDSLITNGM